MNKVTAKNCLVVVPMKNPTASKTRLAGVLAPTQRQSLAKILFKRTLEVLKKVQASDDLPALSLAVVTDSAEVTAIATGAGIEVIEEGEALSLSSAVEKAAFWAETQNYQTLCVIPADLAAPAPEDIVRFIKTGLAAGTSAICPSTDNGTNAILVSPPRLIKFCYGENSAKLHFNALEQAGQTPLILPIESLRFDIDHSACLAQAVRTNDALKTAIERAI